MGFSNFSNDISNVNFYDPSAPASTSDSTEYLNTLEEGTYTAMLMSAYCGEAKQSGNPMITFVFKIEDGGPDDMNEADLAQLQAEVYGKTYYNHQVVVNLRQPDMSKRAFLFQKAQQTLASFAVVGTFAEIHAHCPNLLTLGGAVDHLDNIAKTTEGGLHYLLEVTHRENRNDPGNPYVTIDVVELLLNRKETAQEDDGEDIPF